MPRCLRVAALLASTIGTGCVSAQFAVAPSLDIGSYEVSGVETGVGASLEIGGYDGAAASGTGTFLTLSLLGFRSEGDADPILLTSIEARFRRLFRPGRNAGLYYAAGAGAGFAWLAGPRAIAVPIVGEVGGQQAAGPILVSLGLRDRIHVMFAGGSPPLDGLNSVQLVFGLGITGTR